MKKILSLLLAGLLLINFLYPISVSAADTKQVTQYLSDGSYFVTEIEGRTPNILSRSSSTTKSKIKTYYSSNGIPQWYVKVTGTFVYGGGTSQCTSASVSAGSYADNWSIITKSVFKNGNKATASAVAKETRAGTLLNTVTLSVTLTCSANGVFS